MRHHLWTAGDFGRALHAAVRLDDDGATYHQLQVHGIHAHHCDGWEVAAWPCPPAVEVLEQLLEDHA